MFVLAEEFLLSLSEDIWFLIKIRNLLPSTLARICAMPQSFLEKAEKLEQLRWIENGLKIRVAETQYETHAVDTVEDLEFINSKIDWK